MDVEISGVWITENLWFALLKHLHFCFIFLQIQKIESF